MMSHDVDDEQEERDRVIQEMDDGIFNETYWIEDIHHGQPTVTIDSSMVSTISQALDYFEKQAKRNTTIHYIRLKLPTRRGSVDGTDSWNTTVRYYIQLCQRLYLLRNLKLLTLVVYDIILPSEELLPFEMLFQLLQQPLQQQQQQETSSTSSSSSLIRRRHRFFLRSSLLLSSLSKIPIRVEIGTREPGVAGNHMQASQLTDCQTHDLSAAVQNYPSVVEFSLNQLRVQSTLDPILSMLISLPRLRSVHIHYARRIIHSSSSASYLSTSSSSNHRGESSQSPQMTGTLLTKLLCRSTLQDFFLEDIGPLQLVRFKELTTAFYPPQSIHCLSLKNIGTLPEEDEESLSIDSGVGRLPTNNNTNNQSTMKPQQAQQRGSSNSRSTSLVLGTHMIQKLIVPLPSTQDNANAFQFFVQGYLLSNRCLSTQLDVYTSPTIQEGYAEMILSALTHTIGVQPLNVTHLLSVLMEDNDVASTVTTKENTIDSINKEEDDDDDEEPK